MRHWIIRTDRRYVERLAREVRAGRLRQGWGYLPEQDLRLVRSAWASDVTLSEDQQAAWDHAWRLLPDEPDCVQAGDLLLLPNLPAEGVWSLARAGADYEYAIHPETEDHGHMRTVELLREGIDPYGPLVSARLRATMRCRRSHWNADGHSEAIEQLLTDPAPPGIPADRGPLVGAYAAALETFGKRLAYAYAGAELEQPIYELLESLFERVEWCAGPAEHGADFLCHHRDPLGTDHLVAVQLKMWTGQAADPGAFDQLRDAHAHWPGVTSCVLLTTADNIAPGFEQARRGLERELAIPVAVVCRAALLDLLLARCARAGQESHAPIPPTC